MKNLFLMAVLCLLAAPLHAQTPGPSGPARFTLQGRAVDTSSAPLAASTVMLLTAKDSSLINFGRSDEKGAFIFKNVKRGNYILKISYVGYIPLSQDVTPTDNAVVDLGALKLKPITKELFEVVIRTAKAPLSIRGDTIEYNATTFKVPPGSTVEDLLRKLPGVQVDADGNIKAQGQDVKRLTVDGKTFFGADPKMATKNLQADAISKVQVFNDQSEKSKLTGVDDGSKQKTMNLELKEEFKKGGFGKLTAGGGPATGTGARGEVKGNYNKFDAKRQLSLIGLLNNTNQQGLSWDDYQDFRGSNSFNWNDDADFGFNGGFRYFSGGDDDADNLSIPIGGDRGRGFSNNASLGANYNYDTKKNKFSSSYYYSQTRQELAANRTQQNFFEGGSLLNEEQSNQVNFTGAHRVNIRYERQIDSLQTFIFLNNSRMGVGNTSLNSLTNIFRNETEQTTRTSINNGNRVNTFGTANTLLYRHKFKKKGRLFAASATYQLNTSDGTAELNSNSRFFQAMTTNDILREIRQLTATQRSQYKVSLQYNEPLTKRIFWENFYNFSLRSDEFDRNSFNRAGDQLTLNDTLSRYYKNDYLYNRLGTGLRYSYKGVNLSVGGAYQHFKLDGRYASDESATVLNRIDRTFTTFVPNVSLNYDLKNNRYLYGGYNLNVQVPSSRDLQPAIDVSNPLFITTGNPNLLPALSHSVNLGYQVFNPGSFVNIYGNASYNYNINQIIYGRTIDASTGITSTLPVNVTGGRNVGAYIGGGFPLKKTKATLNMSLNGNIGEALTPINGEQYRTNTESYSLNPRLELTPSDRFTFYANADWNVGNTRYELMSSQNQRVINNSYSATGNVKLPADLYVNSTINYTIYRNPGLNFEQRIPIWNASVFKILGKAKKAEVRLSAYDLLNRNIGVSQFAGLNYVQQERVRTLARYFMLSFTYNMRGVSSGNIKQRWF